MTVAIQEQSLNDVGDSVCLNSSVNNSVELNTSSYNCQYGWYKLRPKFLQRFLSAKWALFWLCWAGAMQGKNTRFFFNVSNG